MRSLAHHTRQFLRLSWRHKLGLAQAMLAMPVIALLMRVMGYRRAKNLLHRLSAGAPQNPSADIANPDVWTTTQLAAFAGKHTPGRPSCLVRSLALWWMLRGQGIASEIRIGVRPAQAGKTGIDAHAWVELNGQILNDSPATVSQFAVFDKMPDLPLNAF
ncbi:MAG TPA: lasso peptide biosynthesis B2 protein [Thermoflexales bacterium]|nr:lasso peptide biosynthesis B2 protein [Thermoflexales bacterium]